MKKFIRTTENFTCEHCGGEVVGNGYTNHCPKCLWGKHVDINPGDRANSCRGMMEPISILGTTGAYTILHRCMICKTEKINKVQKEDDFDVVLRLADKRG